MITHIHSATIIVADKDAAVDFYVTKLGWEKRHDDPVGEGYRFVTVAPPGSPTELVLGSADEYPGTSGPSVNQINMNATDIDGTYAAMAERGVDIKPVETMPWGPKATWWTDPDGNTFFLIEE
jgi:catechol 2,3-dioxygenase-like lactoylglutathione lyase family enzyme